VALADLPDHPQILAAIASIDARRLCTGSATACDGDGAGAGDGDDGGSGCSSPQPRCKDVLVKHGKKQLRVSYTPALGGSAAWHSISRAFDLDPSKMKLLLRGCSVQQTNIVSALWRRAI
jgi:hypothetical protein